MLLFDRKLIAAASVALLAATSSSACTDRAAAEEAVGSSDFAAAEQYHETISIDPGCDDAFRLWLDEAIARNYFALALKETSAEQRQALIEKSIGFFPHWRSYVALADIASDERNHAEEARQLQTALNQMNDGPDYHAVTETDLEEVLSRVSTAMLLSDEVIAALPTRSGAPGGIFIENLRGFKVEEVSLAIEYDFDSVRMTSKGRDYADQLVAYLKQRQPKSIALEGHTDPVGADSYNQALSLRRANALRDYLISAGFQGEISVHGKGESNLPPAPSGYAIDSPQHHQAARRVVLIRG